METVANFTDNILLGLNNNKYALSIFVDLMKASDSVNQNYKNMVLKKIALCIYHSKILPFFDYGNIFYNNSFQ